MKNHRKETSGSGLLGALQTWLGSITDRFEFGSFGTTFMVLCIFIASLPVLAFSFLTACAGLGSVSIKTLKGISDAFGWPLATICLFIAGVGVFVHLARKKSDLEVFDRLIDKAVDYKHGHSGEGDKKGKPKEEPKNAPKVTEEELSELAHKAGVNPELTKLLKGN